MNEKTSAIVLRQKEYREKDALLIVLSREYGKLTLVGKGLMKMESKNAGACRPFTVSSFLLDYQEGKTMFSFRSASTLRPNRHIEDNLTSLAVASCVAEIAEKVLMDGNDDPDFTEELFTLTGFILGIVDSQIRLYQALAFYCARVCALMGLNPVVDACVVCGATEVQDISLEEGGFVCGTCKANIQTEGVDVATMKKFRYINYVPQEKLEDLGKIVTYEKKDAELMISFLEIHSGLEIKSKSLLKTL